MGLDQYAYAAIRAGQYDEFYQAAEWDAERQDYKSKSVSKPKELAYWRKHANLQGWMEQLWLKRNHTRTDKTFNNIELELTWDDIDALERAVIYGRLPPTRGFFFGDGNDEYYREYDLKFITDARTELFCGLKVFYNSSW